jgi:hypothetical protein
MFLHQAWSLETAQRPSGFCNMTLIRTLIQIELGLYRHYLGCVHATYTWSLLGYTASSRFTCGDTLTRWFHFGSIRRDISPSSKRDGLRYEITGTVVFDEL